MQHKFLVRTVEASNAKLVQSILEEMGYTHFSFTRGSDPTVSEEEIWGEIAKALEAIRDGNYEEVTLFDEEYLLTEDEEGTLYADQPKRRKLDSIDFFPKKQTIEEFIAEHESDDDSNSVDND